jgi:UDP-glucose:glycoprotein glucosyltransferase
MHPPEGWMIEVVRSPFDLDNIYLKEVESAGALGEYELEHLIIEGHCYDMISGQSPRGLQFNLGTSSNPNMYDTIVMANLVSLLFEFTFYLLNKYQLKGYFQLKSSPGSWILQLREGRSQEIYEIVSHENTDSLSRKSAQVTIVIDSFEAKIIKIKVC